MKRLTGYFAKLKYLINDYVPNTLATIEQNNSEQAETTIQTAFEQVGTTIIDMENYMSRDLALVFEHQDIYENIEIVCDCLIDAGMDSNRLQFTDDDYFRISHYFVNSLLQKPNQEWFAQLIQNAVLTRLFEIEHPNENLLAAR